MFSDSLPLHDYQKQAVNFIKNQRYAGLFLDVGMGKSLITLAALSDLPKAPTLVIAPKSIAKNTWTDEIDKWHIPLEYQSLIVNQNGNTLSKKKRHELYEQVLTNKPKIYFTSRDLITDCVKYYLSKTNKVWPFAYVVIDESQSFKSHNSKRFKSLKKVRPVIYRLIELTGTPAPSGLMDLWSQIYLLDRGQKLGPTMEIYRRSFFKPIKYIQNRPVKWAPLKYPGYNAERDIYQRIKPHVISMKNTKLSLPPVTYTDDKVELSSKERNLYNTFLKKHVLSLAPDLDITAQNSAVLMLKLSQMASGALYVNDEHDFAEIHQQKLKRLNYIINNTDSPVIVAYHFKSDLKMIKDYLSQNHLNFTVFDNSKDQIDAWNNRQIPILLLQPASSGFGLNLQYGGHTLVWYTLPWSLEQYQQTNGRLNRQGQKEPVIIHHLICKNTVDIKIMQSLKQKDITQTSLMNAVKYAINQ